MVHRLTGQQARRIAMRAQRLDLPRPTDLVETVRHLTILQVDPTAAIAPNADLVLWTRLGEAYRPDHLVRALEVDRTLGEVDARIRPVEDLHLHVGGPLHPRTEAWLEDNASFADDIVARLRADGPLRSRDIADTAVRPWRSTGWTNDKNVTRMLECLTIKGRVAIAARQGRERVWDVFERVHPTDAPDLSPAEAEHERNVRRLASLGIARSKAAAQPVEPSDVGETGEPAIVGGVRGEWRVDPRYLDGARFRGRTALLSPFDRLVHDRVRAQELFGFAYVLEMYKPAKDRRWGYFALPILHGDELVGKLDAKVDRKRGVLDVFAVHEDAAFDDKTRAAVDAEITALARWLDVEVVRH